MSNQEFPLGRDEKRVHQVLAHDENQTEVEEFADIESALEVETMAGSRLPAFATVPMDQFPLKWRFRDERYDVVSAAHLAQVKPLARTDAKQLWDLITQAQFHDDIPFTKGYFRSVVSTPIGDSHENPDEQRRIRKWLYQRGIPFRERVLLSYQPDTAIETTWKMLIKYWQVFYYPISDDLTVIDGTFNWALLFFHEHEAFFGSNLG